MGVPSMQLLAARKAAAAGFDPVADIGWDHVYWADGPEFAALGLADGANVTSWPDEVGTSNLAPVSTAPTFTASWTAGNNAPAVTGSDSSLRHIRGAFGASKANPLSVVIVGVMTAVNSFPTLFDNSTGAAAAIYKSSVTTTNMQAGATLSATSTADTNPHLHVAYFNSTSSVLERDGTSLASGSTGTLSMAGITLFAQRGTADNSTRNAGPIAFAGIYSGDVRGDGGWADFESWVTDTYGITIA